MSYGTFDWKSTAEILQELQREYDKQQAEYDRSTLRYIGNVSKSKWYLAGPMTGRDNNNYDLFHDAAKWLSEQYEVEVVNPADAFDGDQSRSQAEYYADCLPKLTECSHIVFLPEWWQSAGAKIEYALAKQIDIEMSELKPYWFRDEHNDLVHEEGEWELTEGVQPPVGHEGDRLVYGARRDSYKDPRIDFEGTAKMWSAIVGKDIPIESVPLMMIALKMNRLINNPGHEDSMHDIVGYVSCYQWMDRVKRSGE